MVGIQYSAENQNAPPATESDRALQSTGSRSAGQPASYEQLQAGQYLARQTVAATHRGFERTEQMRDRIRVVGHQRAPARQDRVTAAAGGEHLAHPQHAPGALEGLRHVPV